MNNYLIQVNKLLNNMSIMIRADFNRASWIKKHNNL